MRKSHFTVCVKSQNFLINLCHSCLLAGTILESSVLPFPKKLKKLAHPRLFYHPMAAEGSTVIPHQVTESSTEKRENTDFFFTSKTKHKQNNCFPGICNKKFDTYHLYLPIILQLYFIRSWFT